MKKDENPSVLILRSGYADLAAFHAAIRGAVKAGRVVAAHVAGFHQATEELPLISGYRWRYDRPETTWHLEKT